ncbi:hypothetical protein SS50377_26253 [Spironucleus salmonicida]|uniref:Uncharacterized protein n=1 Tax=Spironucleus salmonicida TaxID=348837 RepID=A0A9P8LPP0_9EUKA|nr:hypothetical protein SS50377_26253 [Spironucleus salmonicida]
MPRINVTVGKCLLQIKPRQLDFATATHFDRRKIQGTIRGIRYTSDSPITYQSQIAAIAYVPGNYSCQSSSLVYVCRQRYEQARQLVILTRL